MEKNPAKTWMGIILVLAFFCALSIVFGPEIESLVHTIAKATPAALDALEGCIQGVCQ